MAQEKRRGGVVAAQDEGKCESCTKGYATVECVVCGAEICNRCAEPTGRCPGCTVVTTR